MSEQEATLKQMVALARYLNRLKPNTITVGVAAEVAAKALSLSGKLVELEDLNRSTVQQYKLDVVICKMLHGLQLVIVSARANVYGPQRSVVMYEFYRLKDRLIRTLIFLTPSDMVQWRIGLTTNEMREPTFSIRVTCPRAHQRPSFYHWPERRIDSATQQRIRRVQGSYPPTQYVHYDSHRGEGDK